MDDGSEDGDDEEEAPKKTMKKARKDPKPSPRKAKSKPPPKSKAPKKKATKKPKSTRPTSPKPKSKSKPKPKRSSPKPKPKEEPEQRTVRLEIRPPGKKGKFYQLEMDGKSLTTSTGKLGTDGRCVASRFSHQNRAKWSRSVTSSHFLVSRLDGSMRAVLFTK